MEQSVTVYDKDGKIVGETYPKRAKGLVKKGRAVYVGEDAIRLCDCGENDSTEES